MSETFSPEKDAFFDFLKSQYLYVTYGDVVNIPQASEVPAGLVDITSQFAEGVPLKTPIVSAAMDTVTTSDMAIAMAKLGGIGVIHGALSPEDQKREVRKVKRHLNGRIDDPVTVLADQTVESVLRMQAEKGYDFQSFPVTDSNGVFVGLLTGNDFKFARDLSQSVESTMTLQEEVISADPDTTIEQAFDIMQKNKKGTLPLLNKDGTVAGLYVESDVSRIVLANAGKYNVDQAGRLLVAAALSTKPQEAIERIGLMRHYVDVVVIDSARGDGRYARETLEVVKSEFPDLPVVAGNITSAKSAKMLIDAGANGIKIGQGPGTICSTRQQTGAGLPQVSAVYQCAKVADAYGIPVCADGGIVDPGDVPKAITAGANSVMIGSLLAATDEAAGQFIVDPVSGERSKFYRGMGSASALRDNSSSRQRYGMEGVGEPLAEGVEAKVEYAGSVSRVMNKLELGLRTGMEYVGAATIDDMRYRAEFARVTPAGAVEGKPHNVQPVSLAQSPNR